MSLKVRPTLKSSKIKVGITIGDPSGIGAAITVKALRKLVGLADFTVIGDAGVLNKSQGHKVTRLQGYKVIDLDNVNHNNFQFGKIRAEYGKASVEYLNKALQLLKSKEIDCLVTCPVSKEAVALSGMSGFRGHTEYLSSKTRTKDYVMFLTNDRLKFALVTRHIPLKEVSSQLSRSKLAKTILLTYAGLKSIFALNSPRIAVCGLNPHASDNGLLGKEENSIIKPTVRQLKAKLKHLDGPISADVAIHKADKGSYDALIAMYHDQALIPLKLSGDDSGVNMTLGLPFVRTSPLHGTAFDIAPTPGLANPNSLIAAIKLAVKCTSNLKRS